MALVVMGSTGIHGACTVAKYVKVLLPSSSHKLRISDELARHLDGGGDGGTALVVSPFGKVWRVEVGRDSEGAFLGHGWPEFAGAHGIGVGWFLVLRHEGGSVLTVKAFDSSYFLKEFCKENKLKEGDVCTINVVETALWHVAIARC